MGKKTKIGKQRKDKFYHLAKETGYRSRSAFKLIQLNRKFEFLQKSRVLIDLCAAPGGWLQVAQKYMPVSSVIIGIDLVPIKPIPNVTTHQEDITSDRCKHVLKSELKTWKADIVLNDGAPNVGKNWIHDAFSQVQLTLSALKLASEFLTKGGWFITKVFRSKDYHALLWVFKLLFKKVHATKPQASRYESAEIFVVCQNYIAPAKIDSKFFNPKYLFEEVDPEPKPTLNILHPEKQKKKAEGYPEGDYTLYNQLKASEFIKSNNHIELLGRYNEIIFDDKVIEDHPLTTNEIKECSKDIKVLGKSDLKSLLNWRKKMKEIITKDESKISSAKEIETAVEEIEDEEEEIIKETEILKNEQLREVKRKKKKILKQKQKLHERINLKMVIKNDEPLVQQDIELFELRQIKKKEDLEKLDENDASILADDPDAHPDNTKKRKWATYSRDEKPSDWVETGLEYEDEENDTQSIKFEDDEDEINTDDENNPLLIDLENKKQNAANRWFEKDIFADVKMDDDDLEVEMLPDDPANKDSPDDSVKAVNEVNHSSFDKYQDNENSSGSSDDECEDADKTANNSKIIPNIITNKQKNQEDKNVNNSTDDADDKIKDNLQVTPNTLTKKQKKKKKKIKLDPEGLALGTLMIQSEKTKRDIMDEAYNRYTFNDENLPDWFMKDEGKHYKKNLPVTQELVQEYKARLKEINARPIKKVIEAKARKKKRALRKLEKARKKAEAITESLDMSEKEKTEHIRTIYKKALHKQDKKVTYIIAKKGAGKRVRRPAGVTGKFKVVDRRMKKDKRAFNTNKKKQKCK